MHWKGFLLSFLLFAGFVFLYKHFKSPEEQLSPLERDPSNYTTDYTAPYISMGGETAPSDIQCPIPEKDRVKNHTGTQCVWSSIEMLGRWAEEPKLTEPPLTSRKECSTYSSPSLVKSVLTKLEVKFEQSYQDREQGLELIRRAMEEGRGCLFGVPGHAMVLVHFDEEKDVVKWVDNSDYSLKVQTMNVERFKKRWDSWACVIYADNDIIPAKTSKAPYKLPIIDHNLRRDPKIPMPSPFKVKTSIKKLPIHRRLLFK